MGLPKSKPELPVEIEESFDDEAATVVIDLNKLKEEFSSTPNTTEDIPIEFNANSTNTSLKPSLESQIDDIDDKTEVLSAELSLSLVEDLNDPIDLSFEKTSKVVLFDLSGSDLKEIYTNSMNQNQDNFDFQLISQLNELNQMIKQEDEMTVVFYYNQAPKAINTLMSQINSRFKHVKTMIIAKNLSEQKAQMHKKTPSGADLYLSSPENFQEVIDKLNSF